LGAIEVFVNTPHCTREARLIGSRNNGKSQAKRGFGNL
jgi:hypothetical protein